MRFARHHLIAALCCTVLAAACGGGTVTDGTAPTPPADTAKTPPPTVQRAAITVRVTVDPADAVLAQQAGIDVSGLTVRLVSSRAGDPVRTAVTAADGSVRFDNLLEGIYLANVDRTLSSSELARLSSADREASVFAGGAQVVLSPPTASAVAVGLVAARRGSLVISEIFANYGPLQFTEPNYVFGSYIEVYNNSDTTAYLDGMLLAVTPGWHGADSGNGTCSDNPKRLRLDTTAVYSAFTIAFPGSGRDYPILPGQSKVVAMDAINHQAAAPTKEQVDLSHAPFEQFWTDADVDNPESVNMIKIFGPGTGVFGHGLGYFSGRVQHVLLKPGARAAATTVTVPTFGANGAGTADVLRLPSEFILDLVALEYNPLTLGYENNPPRCVPWTAPSYDRAPAPLVHDWQFTSITRKGLGFTADGREILQRTKNSERDFQWAVPLRRSLNK